jgi:signal transduction histidine kinase
VPLLFPLTIALAVLRHRLWDIDILVNRSLVYGALTALVVLSYVVLVGGLGQLLRSNSTWIAVLTTGAVALAISPLRDWLQKRVNRLLYGEQDDPVQLLARLGARLEATAQADELLPTLVQTAASVLKLPFVAVQLSGADGPVATHGTLTGSAETWPLLYQGEVIGQLQVAPRAAGETFTPHERRLLAAIAQQAGAAAHAVRLTADLRQSRQRIVIAREEERRRLRRDLHDGLGPQLATLTVQIDAARNALAYGGPGRHESADGLLEAMRAGTQAAIAEVRRVVHDLRPPSLDQLGLVESLRHYANTNQHNGLVLTIESPAVLPPLPAAVEVAAYRIAVEALTNVSRHAQATVGTVRLALAGAALRLEISDNGRGFSAETPPGVGLASMRERAAELGGTFTVQSGSGTVVAATLPLTP